MKIEKYRHPFIFYGFAILVPWTLWFILGAISHSSLWENRSWVIFGSVMGVIGLCVPMIMAFIMILPDKEMRDELKSATFSFKGIHWGWYVITFVFPFAVILLAQAISLLFGHSPGQFRLVENFSFTAGILPAWFLMLIAPIVEEFGWRTYGTHCIRRRFNLITTCFIFGLIWGFWHMPLSTVKGYYQNVLMETGMIYQVNFIVSLIPYLIIDSWVYYKTRRNMFLQVGTHLTFGYSMEVFRTHPDSKLIHTVLLMIFCVFLVIKERRFFFDKAFAIK